MTKLLGTFQWYDYMAEGIEEGRNFYSEVMGWKQIPFGEDQKEGEEYMMLAVGDLPIAGTMELTADAKAMGAPSHWMGYIGTPNVDATIEQAKELGAKVYMPAISMPDVGRFAVLADPQGAVFAVFQPETESEDNGINQSVGHPCWHELMTSDQDAAWEFYSTLFGWEITSSMKMGSFDYNMFNQNASDADSLGGFMPVPDENTPPMWLIYFTVDSLDEAIGRAERQGGKVVNGPMSIPGGDRVAQLVDASGGMFALYESVTS